jgi:dihydroorotate dehydrogenase electron transfer subunit
MRTMPKIEEVPILEQQKIGPRHYKLTLSSEYIAQNAVPGQFVEVKVSDLGIPLLRRPLSIHRASGNSFEILYEVIGPGTILLSQKQKGEKLNVLGPLGKGFKIESDDLILVAGGLGVAPLRFLADEAVKHGKKIHALLGAGTKECVLCEKDLLPISENVKVTTDDGSYGEKGLVTDLLNSVLLSHSLIETTIYACGPRAMLAEVARVAGENEIPCQVSLEAYMACGIGACLGCAVETLNGYKMACKDGPVFNAEEIKW